MSFIRRMSLRRLVILGSFTGVAFVAMPVMLSLADSWPYGGPGGAGSQGHFMPGPPFSRSWSYTEPGAAHLTGPVVTGEITTDVTTRDESDEGPLEFLDPRVRGLGPFLDPKVIYGVVTDDAAAHVVVREFDTGKGGRAVSSAPLNREDEGFAEDDNDEPLDLVSDLDVFGPTGAIAPVVDRRGFIDGPFADFGGKAYVLHNDDDSLALDNLENQTPRRQVVSTNDIGLARVDLSTDTVEADLAVGTFDPETPTHGLTDGFTAHSTPLLIIDDLANKRRLWFVAQGPMRAHLFKVRLDPDLVRPDSFSRYGPGDIGDLDLNVRASPVLATFGGTDYVLLAGQGDEDSPDLVTVQEKGQGGGPSGKAVGDPQTPAVLGASIVVAYELPKPPSLAFPNCDSTAITVVRRFKFSSPDNTLVEDDASGEICGAPSPRLAVTPEYVAVTTSHALVVLNASLDEHATLPGAYGNNPPAIAGNVLAAQRDDGQHLVLQITDGGFEAIVDSRQEGSSTASGQPAISRGRLLFTSDAGIIADRGSPRVIIVSPGATAPSGSEVLLKASTHQIDPDAPVGLSTFRVDGVVVEGAERLEDGHDAVTFDAGTVRDGMHLLRVEAGDGMSTGTATKIFSTNAWSDPTAGLLGPAIAGRNEEIVVTASGKPTPGEAETIESLELDLDGNGEYEKIEGETRPDGEIVAEATATFAGSGTRSVILRVTDSHGDVATATHQMTVVNRVPEVALSASPSSPTIGERVVFAATAQDPDGDATIASYEWDLDGDGLFELKGGAPTASRAYSQAGVWSATVRAIDDEGASDMGTHTFTVAAAPEPSPTSSPTAEPTPSPTPAPMPTPTTSSEPIASAPPSTGGSEAGIPGLTPRVRLDRLELRVRKRGRRAVVTGRLRLPLAFRSLDRCAGSVELRLLWKRRYRERNVRLRPDCTFRRSVRARGLRRVGARFEGTELLAPKSARSVRVRYRAPRRR